MIIFVDKNLHQNSLYPDSDWTGNAKWIIPDSNTELCQKAFEYCPYFDIIEDEEGEVVDIIQTETPLDILKSQKISEMSLICESNIISGITYNGKHYSLTITDQLNLNRINASITDTTTSVTYHADGQLETNYSVIDFRAIYQAAAAHISSEQSYFNALKYKIKNMTSSDEVAAVYYGINL